MKSNAVYFVQADASGLIKIGTSGNSDKRIGNLRGANGSTLTVLAIIRPADRAVEQALHERFAEARHHGEWFNPVPELLEFIEQLKTSLRQMPVTPHARPAAARKPYRVIAPREQPASVRPPTADVLDSVLTQLAADSDPLISTWAKKLLQSPEEGGSQCLIPAPQPSLATSELKRIRLLLQRAHRTADAQHKANESDK